jgi:hypothetical protein
LASFAIFRYNIENKQFLQNIWEVGQVVPAKPKPLMMSGKVQPTYLFTTNVPLMMSGRRWPEAI